jgi:hypothetical protein
MSDAADALRALVPAYAGHADAAARKLSDQEVRAVAGELLAALAERLGPAAFQDPAVQERFDDLLLHCEFGDQHSMRALDGERFGEPEIAAQIEADDRALLETAARAPEVTAPKLAGFLADLARAVDRRSATVARLARSAGG